MTINSLTEGVVTASKYEVVRPWRYVDPRDGAVTEYAVGDPWDGPTDKNPYLLDPGGPDGAGPLIAEKATPDKGAADKPESKEK